MDADKSISPVDALMLSPVVELNVPPVVPDIVGVGSLPETQYSVDAYVNVPSSSADMFTPLVAVVAHKLLDVRYETV